MAEEVKVSKGTDKKEKAAAARANFSKFFKDIRSELKKVIWPTRKQLINNTVTVLFACLFVGAIIWVVDAGLNYLLQLILNT